MQIYLPIAEISVNIFLLIGLGGIVGILSGMFGVGGGFFMTPLYSSLGSLRLSLLQAKLTNTWCIFLRSYCAFQKKNVDLKMGFLLILGGVLGSIFGVEIFRIFKGMGQLELIIKLCYVIFLGVIGIIMFFESLKTLAINQENKNKKNASSFLGTRSPSQNAFSGV